MVRYSVPAVGIAILCVSLACVGLVAAEPVAPPVELIEGLQSGQIWAQFWGAGDTGVSGVVGRAEGGPGGVTVAPGTQFWAQASGRQGQTSLGSSRIDLGSSAYAQIWIPTACTNIGRPAPTAEDIMVPSPCPSRDMARLSRSLVLEGIHRPMVQVAVWAVANDPPARALRRYLAEQVKLAEGSLTADDIMYGAADLLRISGLDPAAYRMFR